MIKYSSYTDHLRFSLLCYHNKILPKDPQLKRRIKTERSKIILHPAGKLLLQERIHINHVIRDRLKNSKPPKDNLSKDERKALKELQSDTSTVILPADKGRSTVILNREDYLEKCMDHINNGPYQLLKKDSTTKIKAKTLKQLKVLKDNEFIDNKLYYYLKPTDSPAPRFYGQPKIHKPGVPIRPIVSYSGSLLYNRNKYIPNILKTYVKHENNNAKNSTTFSSYIRNVPIEDDEIMVSFDVTSLYTNIPIIDTLNIIKDYVHSDG